MFNSKTEKVHQIQEVKKKKLIAQVFLQIPLQSCVICPIKLKLHPII